MSTPTLESTKKCPDCQQWSGWQLQPTDRCEHCGALLDPRALQSAMAREKLANQKMPLVLLVKINPEDGPFMRFFKTIVRGGQLLFGAILAFLVWLVAAVAA